MPVIPLSKYTIAGPTPGIDGRRAFRGAPQLTDTERSTLLLAARIGIHAQFERGEEVFYCGSRKIARSRMLRLLQLRYLIGADDGLLDETPQSFLVNVTPLVL